jgi:hypothetical protein
MNLTNHKRIIQAIFVCESFTNRNNVLVMFTHAKNELERRRMSPFSKIGRISGQTLRGWLRHAVEKLLLQNGVSVCHPLSGISVTGSRNKEYFNKEDLPLGYHPRGDCAEEGGCLVYQIFGDLDKPSNLIVPSAYFYPTVSGNGTATKTINRVFGSVGGGRVEIAHFSPRARKNTHQTYMSMEEIVAVMVEAPFNLIIKDGNPDHEIVLLKALDYLKTMVQEYEFDFLLGGMRDQGYGRAAVLPMKRTRKKSQSNALNSQKVTEEVDEGNSTFKIQFKMTKADATQLEREFSEVIAKEKAKFPTQKWIENEEKEPVEAKA